VVLDAPASGQVVGLLAAPWTFGSIARVGPVARQGAAIDRMLTDPASMSVIAVAVPEQMAVSEALGLRRVVADEFAVELGAVVVNQLFPPRFSAKDGELLLAAPDEPAVRSARWFHARGRAQRMQLGRLRRGLGGVRSLTLPFMFTEELERRGVEHLAGLLEGLLL
jgi:anion-transporting  ArsA/GET3 family ATPase